MNKKRWTQWEQDVLVSLWKEDKPVNEISIIMGRSEKSIYQFVIRNRERLNLNRRKRKKQSENIGVMPTPAGKRFWLGLIDRFLK